LNERHRKGTLECLCKISCVCPDKNDIVFFCRIFFKVMCKVIFLSRKGAGQSIETKISYRERSMTFLRTLLACFATCILGTAAADCRLPFGAEAGLGYDFFRSIPDGSWEGNTGAFASVNLWKR